MNKTQIFDKESWSVTFSTLSNLWSRCQCLVHLTTTSNYRSHTFEVIVPVQMSVFSSSNYYI
jgi:hypothetical protein